MAAGPLLMARLSEDGGQSVFLFGTVAGEAGFMLSKAPLTIAASVGAGEEKRGLAAGLMNASIQVGNAWGLGVTATVVAATAGPRALVGGLR